MDTIVGVSMSKSRHDHPPKQHQRIRAERHSDEFDRVMLCGCREYHLRENKYSCELEIKSKTIGLHQITDITDITVVTD